MRCVALVLLAAAHAGAALPEDATIEGRVAGPDEKCAKRRMRPRWPTNEWIELERVADSFGAFTKNLFDPDA
jgi:hypothetical protein